MSHKIRQYVQTGEPTLSSYWRSIILFGDNVASYKFALGKALLTLARQGHTSVNLTELAVPFSAQLVEHLRSGKPQTTSQSSRFLDACRRFADGTLSEDELIASTVNFGFNNVIDAFHNVSGIHDMPRFFIDERKTSTRGIVLCDQVLELAQSIETSQFDGEIEARWNLVETSWSLGVNKNLLRVMHDTEGNSLYVQDRYLRRINVTSSRDALNGYQKGKCFYCFDDLVEGRNTIHVDHFFPHSAKRYIPSTNLDGVWNLVLACSDCNMNKSNQRPCLQYVHRLSNRNEYLISSNHPLRETLVHQTGDSDKKRMKFLNDVYNLLGEFGLLQTWSTDHVGPIAF